MRWHTICIFNWLTPSDDADVIAQLRGSAIIRTLKKIIVELIGGYWFASFEDNPQFSFGGKTPEHGIEKLLSHFGDARFTDELIALDNTITDSYREVVVPLRRGCNLALPSLN